MTQVIPVWYYQVALGGKRVRRRPLARLLTLRSRQKQKSRPYLHKDDFRRGSTLFYGYIRLLFALAPRRDPESVGGTFETPCNLPFSRGKALCLPHLSKTCPRPPRLRQGLS